MNNVVDACVSEGVQRFVHVSNVYVYGMPTAERVNETQPLQPCSPAASRGACAWSKSALKMFAAAGAEPKLRVAGKGLMRFLGLFMPIMRELVEMNYLHSTPVNLADAKLEALLGPLTRTSYDDGIAAGIAEMRRRAGQGS